jgi:hypothetical protein
VLIVNILGLLFESRKRTIFSITYAEIHLRRRPDIGAQAHHPDRKAVPSARKPDDPKPLAPLVGLPQNEAMRDDGSLRKRWSEEETVLALYLYFQLPFGKLHSGNPEIQQLATALGRSSSSVAMKLCNFASLDPKITESGRKGLDGASKLDRATYAEFSQDWTGLVARAESMWTAHRVSPRRPLAGSRTSRANYGVTPIRAHRPPRHWSTSAWARTSSAGLYSPTTKRPAVLPALPIRAF